MGCSAAQSALTNENIRRSKTNIEPLDLEDFINQMLKLHNEERKKNDSEELKLNKDLNSLALEYSENIKSNPEKIKKLKYINLFKELIFGENIAYSETKEPKKIFETWLNKDKNYETNSNKFLKANAHYTQIIWKNTKEIGISMSYDEENNRYCTVILYNPPGNTLGSFHENI